MATKASALCGALPSHHVVGVVQVPLAPAPSYSPLSDPETLRTPLTLRAPALLAGAVFSLLSLLPSRAFSLSSFAGLRCFPPPRALSFLVWFCPPRCLLSCWVFLASPFLVGLAFSCVCVVPLCVFGLFLLLCFVLIGLASRELTEVTKDGRGLSTPTIHTHPPIGPSPFSSSGWRLVFPFFRLSGVSARLFCCLVPLALTSYSVRGVGCSRPEPWTRLHCSGSHLREPVVLSAGQSGAPVKQQSLRTWIVSFFFGSAVTQLAHSSGEWRLFWISRLLLVYCNALQVLC